MKLKDSELNTLHKVEIELLRDVLKVINKLGLKYFLIAGSSLGAVRHKGFIPWDDDIDLGMPRKDYDIFIKEAQNYLPKHLFLQTQITDKQHPNFFAKVRNSNTTYLEKANLKRNINHGIFIDIFPFDGAGNSLDEALINFKKYSLLQEKSKFLNKTFSNKGLRNKLRIIYYTIIVFIDRLLRKYSDVQSLYEYTNNFCSSIDYENSLFVANYSSGWREKEIVLKEWLGSGKIVEFESLQVYIPVNHDKYLTKLYGDYMTPPPIEKRVSPHCIYFSEIISYVDVIEKFRNEGDTE